MKTFLLFGILIAAPVCANTVDSVFRPESALPFAVKERILAAVQIRCAKIVSENQLSELSTAVTYYYVDRDLIDYFYFTTFSSRYSDGAIQKTATIRVESSLTNRYGDPIEIANVTSSTLDCMHEDKEGPI
jgi:hypothetical protein